MIEFLLSYNGLIDAATRRRSIVRSTDLLHIHHSQAEVCPLECQSSRQDNELHLINLAAIMIAVYHRSI